MNKLLAFPLIICALSLAQTAVAATPAENAAVNVIKAAQKGDYDGYRNKLVGVTGQKFGDMTTFNNFHDAADGYKKLKGYSSVVTANHGFRVYDVDVYAQNPRTKGAAASVYITTATVQCVVDKNYEPGFCYGGWDWGWGWGRGDCFSGYTYTNENCSVTAFQNNPPSTPPSNNEAPVSH